MRRPLFVALALAFGAAAVPLLPILPAHADEVAAITVGPGQTIEKDEAPILGQDTVTPNVLGDPSPDNCQTLPSCNVVPVTFSLPKGYNKLDTYVATVSLTWQSVAAGNRNVGAASNDLDLYLWAEAFFEPECKTPPNAPADYKPPAYCTHDLAKSANSGQIQPEVVKLDATDRQKFLLLVNNSTGANTGYHIKIESRYSAYSRPLESLDSGFAPSGAGSAVAPPPDLSAAGPAVSPVASETTPAVTAPDLSALGGPSGLDPDVANIQGSNLADVLQGGKLFKAATVRTTSGRPPSSLALVIWLVLVPLLVAGLGAAWFVRRRPAALRI
jgi:hypothetical protein